MPQRVKALNFSNSLTFLEFWIKCWNSLTFPKFFGQKSNSLTFSGSPDLSGCVATLFECTSYLKRKEKKEKTKILTRLWSRAKQGQGKYKELNYALNLND